MSETGLSFYGQLVLECRFFYSMVLVSFFCQKCGCNIITIRFVFKSDMFPVGHGSQDGAMTTHFESPIVPSQHQGVVFLLGRFEEAVNVLHQHIHGFLVQGVDSLVDVFLAWKQ